MANSFDEAYRDVELAYSQGRFAEALERGELLLRQGSPRSGDPHALRLKLLMGHSHLYGLRQPQEAAELYHQVLASSSEPTYRDLAAEGLSLCQQALQESQDPSGAPAMPWVSEAEPMPLEPIPAAAPWQEAAVGALAGTARDSDPVEPVRVEVLAPSGEADTGDVAPPRFSPAEEAELAKGILRVVLR